MRTPDPLKTQKVGFFQKSVRYWHKYCSITQVLVREKQILKSNMTAFFFSGSPSKMLGGKKHTTGIFQENFNDRHNPYIKLFRGAAFSKMDGTNDKRFPGNQDQMLFE